MPKYFDIHSHLNFSGYEGDFDAVLGRMRETGTHTIVVGTDLESSKKAVELSDRYEEIYACIGIHPVDHKGQTAQGLTLEFSELVKHPKVVAIGECGMDFYHADKAIDYERQKELFLAQIHFALEHDKPIMIHARNAYDEILEILEPLKREHGGKLKGNVHFFAGDVKTAERFFALGFTISFTGVITFTRDYDEVIRAAPLENVMSETDAPFVAPAPHRGQRNEPSYVVDVAKKLAEIRGEDGGLVEQTLIQNARALFKI